MVKHIRWKPGFYVAGRSIFGSKFTVWENRRPQGIGVFYPSPDLADRLRARSVVATDRIIRNLLKVNT